MYIGIHNRISTTSVLLYISILMFSLIFSFFSFLIQVHKCVLFKVTVKGFREIYFKVPLFSFIYSLLSSSFLFFFLFFFSSYCLLPPSRSEVLHIHMHIHMSDHTGVCLFVCLLWGKSSLILGRIC